MVEKEIDCGPKCPTFRKPNCPKCLGENCWAYAPPLPKLKNTGEKNYES